ncbi:hypothetical protein D3C72_1179170 [compost metagenome]
MLSVPALACCRETTDQHIGTILLYRLFYRIHHLFPVPEREGLIRRLAETEIDKLGKELSGAIQLPGPHHFIGTDQPQCSPLFIAQDILPAITAGKRQINSIDMVVMHQVCDQPGILIVRMCSDVHYGTQSL